MGSGPRYHRRHVEPLADRLVSVLDRQAVICGSLRRGLSTCGDIDLVLLDGLSLSQAIEVLEDYKWLVTCTAAGGPRTRLGNLDCRFGVDIWEPDFGHTGACVYHATGSGPHNTLMRRWARVVHGLSVTWRGVQVISTGEWLETDGTEESVVRYIPGWPMLDPSDREVNMLSPNTWLKPLLDEMNERDRLAAKFV